MLLSMAFHPENSTKCHFGCLGIQQVHRGPGTCSSIWYCSRNITLSIQATWEQSLKNRQHKPGLVISALAASASLTGEEESTKPRAETTYQEQLMNEIQGISSLMRWLTSWICCTAGCHTAWKNLPKHGWSISARLWPSWTQCPQLFHMLHCLSQG